MKIYSEVELPELCLPMEAVFWLALGRPPEIYWTEAPKRVRGNVEWGMDFRINPDVVWDGGPSVDTTIHQEDLEGIGISVDTERFINGSSCIYESYEEYLSKSHRPKRSEFSDSEWAKIETVLEQFDAETKSEIADFAYVKLLSETFQPLLDLAAAKVFSALAEGKITGKGWVKTSPENEDDWQYEILDIVPQRWTMKMLQDGHTLNEDGEGEFYCLYIDVSQMLSTFPVPIGGTHQETGQRYISCYIANTDDGPEAAMQTKRKMRGRPPKGAGILRKAVEIEARRIMELGEWPDKAEAQIALMQAHCEKLGEGASRTAVQGWLSSMPENMPKNKGV